MTFSVALPPSPAALRASTSPVEGEVMCVPPPLRLSPGGRGRARSERVRGAPLRSHYKHNRPPQESA
jgi:hypothetical protein